MVLCVISAIGNAAFRYFINGMANIPLYVDTVFTVAMCFFAGLVPGLLTAVLSSVLFSLVYVFLQGFPVQSVWMINVFIICVILEVLTVCLYRRKMKPSETAFLKNPSIDSFTSILIHLLVLAVIACITVSIAGGVIDSVFNHFNIIRSPGPNESFKIGLLRNNANYLAAAILSRIPINIVDRFIVVFGGFGISMLYRKIAKTDGDYACLLHIHYLARGRGERRDIN